ncbi:hypothetical protein B9Z19DRAFT_1064294 [Tuber borchii]|uniref:Uncharacterized protein n=1 Tax=Tuber borchii TaxID=42251 RepID=A0A2T6ZVF6_TUBBO|nr:hypothetical protein B9Z19DRAFT_1064294 [Tuber borchii]
MFYAAVRMGRLGAKAGTNKCAKMSEYLRNGQIYKSGFSIPQTSDSISFAASCSPHVFRFGLAQNRTPKPFGARESPARPQPFFPVSDHVWTIAPMGTSPSDQPTGRRFIPVLVLRLGTPPEKFMHASGPEERKLKDLAAEDSGKEEANDSPKNNGGAQEES